MYLGSWCQLMAMIEATGGQGCYLVYFAIPGPGQGALAPQGGVLLMQARSPSELAARLERDVSDVEAFAAAFQRVQLEGLN